ncbi:MAG: M15 family metallopeptidase [Sulfurimonas sp.]|nr:M15 family metallopeptidase [Sulfurimonas sp.]MDQ7061808.1 M15 family metallopeptidase [Sulfurimonas sp.]
MNRRNFLACTALTPLFANDLMANANDIYLDRDEWALLTSVNARIKRVKKHVGFANFNLISFKDTLFYARNYSSIGAFTKKEIAFLDKLFYEDPKQYGFYGEKTCFDIKNIVKIKEVQKIPYTGHYVFKGKALEDYTKLKQDVGDTLILTSGVRNVVKQLSLYVNKIYNTRGNMTKASESIAPPAHSYHTISDFDVGRKGWGYKNFTADFASTQEFNEMMKLDYIGMRYNKNNSDGVRFEPWHVEVI